ncbi:2-C-methyl-D-erythritol 4-phosphate cytidylyltransferase [Actinomycetospora corticicola]|uniref:2-C-methyl-D-erythritol 4-phosphate cytidylyltransferase n=1 Tax=Actinomycetospora corticicola TaxID=663602 RepID=A0A7Y9E153_9PSEU|nr:2-C-methyl-D-erythritol 4-phosphate cytidylyltransferase [Actinomycetospora corticicola]
MEVVAVVPAAGSGERLGAGSPKALVEVAGVAMVTRAVDGLLASGVVDEVIVVAPPDHLEEMAAVTTTGRVVPGGHDRVASVALGLAEAPDADVVLVHDAARCLCPAAVVSAVVEAVRAGAPAVVPAIPVADTVRRARPEGGVELVDRTGLLAVQTPQGFDADLLRRAHAAAGEHRATDDAGLVEALGGRIVTVPGDPRAFKITTPLDLAMAEALVRAL